MMHLTTRCAAATILLFTLAPFPAAAQQPRLTGNEAVFASLYEAAQSSNPREAAEALDILQSYARSRTSHLRSSALEVLEALAEHPEPRVSGPAGAAYRESVGSEARRAAPGSGPLERQLSNLEGRLERARERGLRFLNRGEGERPDGPLGGGLLEGGLLDRFLPRGGDSGIGDELAPRAGGIESPPPLESPQIDLGRPSSGALPPPTGAPGGDFEIPPPAPGADAAQPAPSLPAPSRYGAESPRPAPALPERPAPEGPELTRPVEPSVVPRSEPRRELAEGTYASAELFPLVEGTTWEYEVALKIIFSSAKEASAVTTVTGAEELGGRRYLRVDTQATGVPGNGRETNYYRQTEEGTYRVPGGKTSEPAKFFLPREVKVGKTWQEEEGGLTYKVEAEEEIETPAGKFRCLRISIRGTKGFNSIDDMIWLSPGVGVVRQSQKRSTHSVTSTLKAFKPGDSGRSG